MNKQIAKIWADMLESGRYGQASDPTCLRECNRDYLGREKVSPLGVLCNIHALNNPKFARKEMNPRCYGGFYTQLPPAVTRWAGMRTNNMCGTFYTKAPLKLPIRKVSGEVNWSAAAVMQEPNEKGYYEYSVYGLAMMGMSFKNIAKLIRTHYMDM